MAHQGVLLIRRSPPNLLRAQKHKSMARNSDFRTSQRGEGERYMYLYAERRRKGEPLPASKNVHANCHLPQKLSKA